jgi:anaerobic magnesium-protoporphyrin IX monomethyl ester cyclase
MNFNQMFYEKNDCDVLLIQPHVLNNTSIGKIDPVQKNYWKYLDKAGMLLGDLPIEPNWGLLYLASSLKKNNKSVHLLDFNIYDYVKYEKSNEFITYNEIKTILKMQQFKIVGISSITRCHHRALEIAKICKKVNPNCKIVLGGIHFSFIPEETVKNYDFIDAVICGEGEVAFVDFVNKYNDIKQWKNIEGIVFLDKNRKIFNNKSFNIIKDLDSLPIPDYSLWPSDIPLIPRIYTARGCVGSCDYCVVNNFFNSKYRRRSLKKVIEEIKYLNKEMNINEFLIGDLCFPSSENDAKNFCKLLEENELNIKWWCQTRLEYIDRNTLYYMKKSGCVQIGIGIESGNEEILHKVNSIKTNKNQTIKSIEKICEMIKEFNILVQGYFIIGLPNENIDTCIETIKLLDRLLSKNLVDVTHLSIMVPYPGTPIFTNPDKYNMSIIEHDFEKYLMNCDLMNSGLPTYNLKDLDNYQIYCLWELALSTTAKILSKRDKSCSQMFNNMSSFIDQISFKSNEEINDQSGKVNDKLILSYQMAKNVSIMSQF